MNPFKITGPAAVQCSLGRTSAMMLYRLLDACNGELPPDVFVLFQNTGKERLETLDFGRKLESEWKVPLIWLEYDRKYLPKYRSEDRREAARKARETCGHVYEEAGGRKETGFRTVSYETADRVGGPFHNLIDLMGLPNQNTRLCTSEMKIRVAKKYMLSNGYTEWDNILGLRADEPKRLARRRADNNTNRWTDVFPLAEAGLRNEDVLDFWSKQSFDLNLPVDENGHTVGGNCDLCYLKSQAKKVAIVRQNPESLSWWQEQEDRTGQTFRPHGYTYRKLHLRALEPEACRTDDELGDCFCGE